MAGAQVLIDLTNSPSFEDKAMLKFFETSGCNLLPAGSGPPPSRRAVDRRNRLDRQWLLPRQSRSRETDVAQEKLIKASFIPLHMVRAPQFLEFLGGIAAARAYGNMVKLPPILFQAIAAQDVARVPAASLGSVRARSNG